MIKDKAVATLKKALASIKCAGMIAQLEQLIEFKDNIGQTRYRIKTIDGTEIKTVDEFIAALDPKFVSVSYPKVFRDRNSNITPNIKLRLGNMLIFISADQQADHTLASNGLSRGLSEIGVTMGYCNDNDNDIEIKPFFWETYTTKLLGE